MYSGPQNRKIRIGYYQSNVATGGVGRYILSLIQGLDGQVFEVVMFMRRHRDPETAAYLEALRKLDVQVYFVDEEGRPVFEPPSDGGGKPGIQERSAKTPRRFSGIFPPFFKIFIYRLRFVLSLKRFFERQRLDILHINLGYYPKLTYLCLAAGLSKIQKKIITVHSIDTQRRRKVFFQKLMARGFDHIIAINEFICGELTEFYEFPIARTRVIYNGVDSLREESNRIDGRAALGIKKDGYLALMPARMDPLKGHDILLRAAALVHLKKKPLQIFLAGDGPLESELKNRSGALGLGGMIIFGGFRNDMPRLYNLCDFVILPSLLEGFPYVLLEGMSAGKPVIGTDVGGVRKMIGEDGAGQIVPAGDVEALARAMEVFLAESSEQLARRGEKGFLRFQNFFSRRQMLKETFACYEAKKGGGA